MTVPTTSPTTAQRPMVAAMHAAMWTVPDVPGCHRVSSSDTVDADSASTLPTLRSMPAVRITNVIPSAMIPISETWRRMLTRLLSPARKFSTISTGVLPPRKMFVPSRFSGLMRMAMRTSSSSPMTLCRRRRWRAEFFVRSISCFVFMGDSR